MYIGKDGARYEVTRDPDRIDPYGIIQPKSNPSSTNLPNATWIERSSGKIEKPNVDATFSAWTTGRQPKPPWSTINEPDS